MTNQSIEQQARDLVELANLINERNMWKMAVRNLLEQDVNVFTELARTFGRMRKSALDSLKIAERPLDFTPQND